MDWISAKKHCIERNWHWSLDFIEKCENEFVEMEKEIRKLKDQQKADRLYNSCNY